MNYELTEDDHLEELKYRAKIIEEYKSLLKEVQECLNWLPNQYYRGVRYKKTYDLASEIDKLLNK